MPKVKKPKVKASKVPFFTHVAELRSGLYSYLLLLIISSIVGYLLQDKILKILLTPLNQPLYYTSPAGGFNFTIKLAIFFGFVVSLPFLVFQVLRFVEPAIPSEARFSVMSLLVSTSVLMLLGILFAYFVSLPAALHFLSKFSSGEVKSLISTSEYFSFVTRYLVGFGLLFQLPLIMIFINKIIRLKFSQLIGLERWVILVAFIVAAILTPTPDFLNQTIMAVPIILLYQLSVLIVWFANRGQTKEAVFIST